MNAFQEFSLKKKLEKRSRSVDYGIKKTGFGSTFYDKPQKKETVKKLKLRKKNLLHPKLKKEFSVQNTDLKSVTAANQTQQSF